MVNIYLVSISKKWFNYTFREKLVNISRSSTIYYNYKIFVILPNLGSYKIDCRRWHPIGYLEPDLEPAAGFRIKAS